MRRQDDYQIAVAHRYNLRWEIYLSRNRLTFWANGGDITKVPEEENLDEVFVRYKVFAYMDNVEGVSEEVIEVVRNRESGNDVWLFDLLD